MRNTGDQRLVSGANCGRDILLSFAECSARLSWYLFFCAGKLSDVMYVPPWRIVTRGVRGPHQVVRPYGVSGE